MKLVRRSSRLARAVKQAGPDVPVAGMWGRRWQASQAGEGAVAPAAGAEKLGVEPPVKQRRTRRRIVRATVITAGAGAVGRAGYAGWKKPRGSSET